MPEADERDIHVGFADSDRAPSSLAMAEFLEHVEAIPEFVAYKAALRESLALQPGDRVLDVGCGIGTHARRIAAEHDGPVIGLDREAMLAHARARTPGSGSVQWLEGDVAALPLPDASVDGCVVERVLKYQPRPERAIAEVVRVLRPGGRLGVFELDYESMALDGEAQVADAVRAMLCDRVADPRMGRRLPRLLRDAGLAQVTTRAIGFVLPWPVHDTIVREPVRLAIDDGRLDRESTLRWLDGQKRPEGFTSIFLGVLAHAERPHPPG